MSDGQQISAYNVSVHRDLFFFGDDEQRGRMKQMLSSLYFINVRAYLDAVTVPEDLHFLVAFCGLQDFSKLQLIAKVFTDWDKPNTHKVLLAPGERLDQEHLLFASELGTRFVASGVDWQDSFREYIKRVCISSQKVGSLTVFEEELERAQAAGDKKEVLNVIEKLKSHVADRNEDVYRILATAYGYMGNDKKMTHNLKAMLNLNPQNLWAANALGRQFLREGKTAQGIEILKRLSTFHELNGERFLAIGDAYADAGQAAEARAAYEQVSKLSDDPDDRFQDGQAKVRLLENDVKGALDVLGSQELSEDIIAFLNLRAVLAAKSGQHDEAMNYYQLALKGSGDRPLVRAKIRFNEGLALARSEKFEQAQESFKESVKLGGAEFRRAAGPLQIVAKIVERAGPAQQPTVAESSDIDDFEMEQWETIAG